MSVAEILSAKSRENNGSGPARALRREAKVPGIIYGDKKDPEMISVNFKDLAREYQTSNFFSKVFTLDIDGRKQDVIAKDIQLHPVSDAPLHVDFQRVNKHSKVNVFVPIKFINEDKSPAIKRGGALNIIIHSFYTSLGYRATFFKVVHEYLVRNKAPMGMSKARFDVLLAIGQYTG